IVGIGHGFSLPSDWGNSEEGNTMWIEVPADYYSGLDNGYWVLDARMANSGPMMRVFSISVAAVDVRGGTTVAFSRADAGPVSASKRSVLGGLVTAVEANIGIGTTAPTERLAVNGRIRAKEVIVETNWSDFVFEPGYRLTPLSEVERRIRTEKHLPGIPSANEVASGGVSLGDMQAKLLQKIEELTLHAIEQEKEIAALRCQVRELQSR
ncbi:MAG TPA: hypothetical protein VLM42_14100, partial [Bryobacteraceae bacterium]|nr:hypothetical protein [Bryobacteraceae bacterium]